MALSPRPEFEPAFGLRAGVDEAQSRDDAEPDQPDVSGDTETAGAMSPTPAPPTLAPPTPEPPTAAPPTLAPPTPVPPASASNAPPHLRDRSVPAAVAADAPASVDGEPASLDPTPGDGEAAASRPAGVRWFWIRQRIVAVCAIAIVLGVGYYLVSLFQVWSTGAADDDGPVDAIVVMGAAQYDGRPSPQLAARLDHVAELWPQGIAPLVVVTGGNIPGDRFTEAEASATYLSERGVPVDALLLENDGSNSYESLEAVADLLEARGLDDILIVTDPYHALRSRLIAEEVGMTASVSSTDTSVVTGGESLRRHLEEAGGVAVGRIIGFDRLTRLVD